MYIARLRNGTTTDESTNLCVLPMRLLLRKKAFYIANERLNYIIYMYMYAPCILCNTAIASAFKPSSMHAK